jgi:N-hydroxyarylamine O-acetyltransferase
VTPGFDLEAYFERIGYSGPRSATLDTLEAIHARHPQAIPFENLNPLLGWPVRLDAASLQRKLVREGRGGYCYEQNLLFAHALRALGFHVTGLAARVLWNLPEGVEPARTHMLLLIELVEGRYVADVGFGGLTLTGPLRLQAGIEQPTPHEPFRLTMAGDAFVMEALIGGAWMALYRFDLHEQTQPDYEVTNWFLSNHPESRFVTGLIAARTDGGRRYALRNNELAVHHANGETERRLLTSAAALRAVLEGEFRLALPDGPELDAALERLIARAA